MPVFTPTIGTGPRQELALAIVEGEGAVKNLIGGEIMPSFPIDARTAHLPKLTLANTLGLRMIAADQFLRAPGTKYERAVAVVNDATISTDLRGMELVVPNETEMEWAAYFDLLAFFAARFGQDISGLTKEYFVAQTVFNTANTFLAAARAPIADYTYANQVLPLPNGMNPIGDIIAAARYGKSIGENYDFVAMSGPVWERVRQAASTLAFVAGIFKGITEVTKSNFTSALSEFGIKDVYVGDSYYNNGSDGAAISLSQIWSNTYVAVGRRGMASTPSGEDGTGVPTMGGFGVSAFWTGFKPGGKATSTPSDTETFSGGNYVETYPQMDINSMVVRIGLSSKPFVANNKCLTLIATNYA